MPTRQWTLLDKTSWGDGPWHLETDKLQWEDPQTGLPCLVVRSDVTGALCGYVGVGPDHPFFGVAHNACALRPAPCAETWCAHALAGLLEVHGGLIFSGVCQEHAHGLCHVPDGATPDPRWWLGFDCAHAGDVMPAIEARIRWLGMPTRAETLLLSACQGVYRDVAYVQTECRRLALQLDDRDWEERLEALRLTRDAAQIPEG